LKSEANVYQKIILSELCSGCGACIGICPTNALHVDTLKSYKPEIDYSLCTQCGLCYQICPGKGYPVCALAAKACDTSTKMDLECGPVLNFWKGYSTDSGIRLESSSGGIATSLLIHLLKTKKVDAVAVVTMEDSYPTVRLTDDPDIVLSAKTSKYSPIPMMQIIKDLQKNPKKIAMTCTPCQMAAFHMAATKLKKLKECLVLAIGLFCGQVKDYNSVSRIAASLGIKYPDSTKFLGWRCGPYPGNARFKLPDGSQKEKPLYPWLDISVPHYALHRCFLCPDGGNWLADMTLGDIHSGGTDETVVVCRTLQGKNMLESAEQAGMIRLVDMNPMEIESCVIKDITRSKLMPALARIKWLSKKGKPVPEYDYAEEMILRKSSKLLQMLNILKYQLAMWIRRGWKRHFLERHPYLMEKTGHFIYRFPNTLPGWNMALFLRQLIKKIHPKKKYL
jgi:coenzyme F420 hydrogenase subunit beta